MSGPDISSVIVEAATRAILRRLGEGPANARELEASCQLGRRTCGLMTYVVAALQREGLVGIDWNTHRFVLGRSVPARPARPAQPPNRCGECLAGVHHPGVEQLGFEGSCACACSRKARPHAPARWVEQAPQGADA